MGADPALDAARKVWKWVEQNQRRTFTARECFQALRGTFPIMAELDPAFEVLLDRGYVGEMDDHKLGSRKPGRRKRGFLVNARLLKEGT